MVVVQEKMVCCLEELAFSIALGESVSLGSFLRGLLGTC